MFTQGFSRNQRMSKTELVLVIFFLVCVVSLSFVRHQPDFATRNACSQHLRFHPSSFIPSGYNYNNYMRRDLYNSILCNHKVFESITRINSTAGGTSENRRCEFINEYKISKNFIIPKSDVETNQISWSDYRENLKRRPRALNSKQIITQPSKTTSNTGMSWSDRFSQIVNYFRGTNPRNIQELVRRKLISASIRGKRIGSRIKRAISNDIYPLKYLAVDWVQLKRENISPVLVFVNKKSGGLQGQRALEVLKKELNNIQVCDLCSQNPSEYLKYYKDSSSNLVILCCGGDGTVGWIMDEVKKSGLNDGTRNISFGIVPFGTGNDLFQHIKALSTSAGASASAGDVVSPNSLVSNATRVLDIYCQKDPPVMPLDRWSVVISPKRKLIKRLLYKALGEKSNNNINNVHNNSMRTVTNPATVPSSTPVNQIQRNNKPPSLSIHKIDLMRRLRLYSTENQQANLKTFNNYFGIGVDGAVAMSFAELRRQVPLMFFHRLMNKIWYAIIGLLTFLLRRRKDLSKCCELRCDGVAVAIPSGCQGIIVTNIGSYAGGSKLWSQQFQSSNESFRAQLAGDGIIEIVGVTGVPHLGKIKTGLASAIPIAQCRHIEFTSTSRLPMQLDGEPWRQRPCKIEIKLCERVNVLIPDGKNILQK